MTIRRPAALRETDYQRLARFRQALRRFLRFSEQAARRAGVSPAQYQLLLFVRSFGDDAPAVSDLADRLQVLHQSAVGLVDRCERAGLVRRRRDEKDRRRVRVALTASGRRLLADLVREHYRGIADLRKAVPRDPTLRFPTSTRRPRRG
ncbi:MAG TPA: MarR family winged helix-turn-helix transcriptional regulator [Thermoanaerobaculia bacterium]|nr:MarR family winged helix-turn-helix transcriptional regulator [Thermoanaerobaculia bacterium]